MPAPTIRSVTNPRTSASVTNKEEQILFVSEWESFTGDISTNTVPEINALASYLDDLAISTEASSDAAIVAANFKGNWNSATAYLTNDSVLFTDGVTYKAILPNTNQTPPNATYWLDTGFGGQISTAGSKASPVDSDKFGIWDSVSGLLKSVTWASLTSLFAPINSPTFTDSIKVNNTGGAILDNGHIAEFISENASFVGSTLKISSADQALGGIALGDSQSNTNNVGIRRSNRDTPTTQGNSLEFRTLDDANGGGYTWTASDVKIASMTSLGDLVLSGTATFDTPTTSTHGATKGYVDGTFSHATSGYNVLPNGLMEQWGTTVSLNPNTELTVTLPIAASSANYNVQITGTSYTNAPEANNTAYALTATNFKMKCGGSISQVYMWRAITA